MPRSTKKRQKQEEEQEPEQPQEQQQTKDEEAPPEKKVKTETDKEERKTEKEAAGAEEDPSKKARVLEKGHIYFLYRPKLGKEDVEGPDAVQRVYMVLKPYWQSCSEKRKPTLIILGRKALPHVQKHDRFWGFVAEVSDNMDDIASAFKEHSYETKTRGDRKVPPARPMGEGVYEITTHNGHSHLVYILTLPDEPHRVQKTFHIDKQASIVVAVKNPDKPSPPQAGLSSRQKAEYPDRLKKEFADRRFAQMETSEFLNYKHCELMLVGAKHDIQEELGKVAEKLEEEEEKDEERIEHVGVEATVFKDLELEQKQNPTEALKGEWT